MEMEKEFDRQQEKLKETQAEITEKNEDLWTQEKCFEETKKNTREGAATKRMKMRDKWDRMMERSKEVLAKGQITYKLN